MLKEWLKKDGTSQYSLSNGVLPSLGARSNRGIALRRFTVSPFDPHYKNSAALS
ncbi:hypothetical protein RND81_10G085800 [Saponaria officinalis]|uniref:Uncharacterized protein n=1 Tax=Saponaria officinalis TaxID=3572 RepID=A0AAW1I2C5_SAPOF